MSIELDRTSLAEAPLAASRTATAAPRAPARDVRAELPPGARLGHFQVEKKLGAGGMGEVYLASDLALDRRVAVKVLPGDTASGAARERLIREARAQARVQHPNIGHIYFIGEDEGRLYFAMEYVNGRTLSQVIEDKPMLPEAALGVIHDAVLGLREAQRSGFTHRDVKPSNLMVDAHGVVKVLDFGIAAGAPVDGSSERGEGGLVQTSLAGTPLYMAPEQARGGAVDFRADIYALGVTLYQLVTGTLPFSAPTFEDLVTLHETAPRPLLPRGLAPRTTSSAIDALIGRMMAPDPKDRFGSYEELLRAIENMSTHYTRPAGFFVRAMAVAVDLLVVLVLMALTAGPLLGANQLPMSALGMPILAALQMLTQLRFGTTLGGALFEIQVVDAATGELARWPKLLRRTLYVYGAILFLGWIDKVAPHPWDQLTTVLYILALLANAVLLMHASARVPGKRTLWDRRSGTLVRYRTR